jgi:hypothetical protein
LAQRLKRWRSVGTATAVCAPALATAVDLAASHASAPANAAASTKGTVAVEPASVLSEAEDAERAEQEAILETYMRRLGMMDGPDEASAGIDALM